MLYQGTHRLVASSTSPSRSNGPLRKGDPIRVHSVLYNPIVVSARALSNASPTLPIEGRIPCSSTAWVKWIEVYWLAAGVRVVDRVARQPMSLPGPDAGGLRDRPGDRGRGPGQPTIVPA